MIRAALTALLLAVSLSPGSAQNPSPAIMAAKPMVDDWRNCALDKGAILVRSGEPAETIAKVALYECRDARQVAREALNRVYPPLAADAAIETIEKSIRELMISIIVQARSR